MLSAEIMFFAQHLYTKGHHRPCPDFPVDFVRLIFRSTLNGYYCVKFFFGKIEFLNLLADDFLIRYSEFFQN